jgi:phosphocarrier protein HPr
LAERNLQIVNEKGLHARASARFVEVVERHDATATVAKDGMSVSGDSIMGLLMLAASRGTSIEVQTDGTEAKSWPTRWSSLWRAASAKTSDRNLTRPSRGGGDP